jgi:hypothetical protein
VASVSSTPYSTLGRTRALANWGWVDSSPSRRIQNGANGNDFAGWLQGNDLDFTGFFDNTLKSLKLSFSKTLAWILPNKK